MRPVVTDDRSTTPAARYHGAPQAKDRHADRSADTLLLVLAGEARATRAALRGIAAGNAFELRGAPAGVYQLLASAPDGRMGSTKVTLREGATIEIDVTLAQRR